MEYLDELYGRWRRYLNYVALLVAIITLFLELIVSHLIIRYLPEMIELPVSYYILIYIFLPSSLNFLLFLYGKHSLDCKKTSVGVKNYISILVLTIQVFVIACVHNVFSYTIILFCFPIILTLVYSNKKLTNIVTIISIFLASISFCFAMINSRSISLFFFIEVFIALMLLISCYIITLLLLRIEKTKRDTLKASTFKQLQLEELIKCDPLTGLHNMTSFYNVLNCSIKNHEIPLSIAVIDIDNFKSVNDTWGHDKGNEVLICLAAQLQYSCGNKGHVFRYGGEEFTVIFPKTTPKHAKTMIESAQKRLYDYMFEFMPQEKISFSCGIASYTPAGHTAQEFFQIADKMMYKAKLSGKNKVLIAD